MGTTVNYYLDITGEVCPLTFVKTKLLVERMASGEMAEVRLNEGEPLENVPRSLREIGHQVLSLEPESRPRAGKPAVYRLRLQKS